MKWMGLTGGLASGKTTVAGLLRSKGYPVIDADEIARLVVRPGSPGLQAVLSTFGQELRLPDGTLDRRALGRKVFGQPQELLKLEAIVHPLVQDEVLNRRKAFARQGFRLAFYDVPLLFERGLSGFDGTVVVSTTEEKQRERLRDRDHLDEGEIANRLASQLPMAQKVLQADYVLRNDRDLAYLESQVDDLLSKLKETP